MKSLDRRNHDLKGRPLDVAIAPLAVDAAIEPLNPAVAEAIAEFHKVPRARSALERLRDALRGWLPLHWAASSGTIASVRTLIAA